MFPAHAGQIEVYQCEDEHGRMGLSDRPCEDLDPTFEFVDMRSVETYGSPRSVSPLTRPGEEPETKVAPRVRTSAALPSHDPDCEPADSNDPWLNRIGKDDCIKPD